VQTQRNQQQPAILPRSKVSALMIQHSVGLMVWAMLFAWNVSVQAQQPNRVFKLGYLTNDSVSVDMPRRNVFRHSLHDLGYIEGQNIVVEYRITEGRIEKLAALAEELVRLKVDAIFAFTTAAVQAAKNATKEIPIVFEASGDPVAMGFVASLARPGGNLTGLSNTVGPELFGKQLEILNKSVPKVTRVAVVANLTNGSSPEHLEATRAAAQALGLPLLPCRSRKLAISTARFPR